LYRNPRLFIPLLFGIVVALLFIFASVTVATTVTVIGAVLIGFGLIFAVAGIAYASDRGISKVEYSADNGATWATATILEAPDNETVSSISIEMGARGSVQMMTMPAIPLDTFISRLERSRSAAGRKGKRRRS